MFVNLEAALSPGFSTLDHVVLACFAYGRPSTAAWRPAQRAENVKEVLARAPMEPEEKSVLSFTSGLSTCSHFLCLSAEDPPLPSNCLSLVAVILGRHTPPSLKHWVEETLVGTSYNKTLGELVAASRPMFISCKEFERRTLSWT